MSRLTIDLTDHQHKSLKATAALEGKTIRQYVLERLFPGDAEGEQAMRELRTLLSAGICEGLAGRGSSKQVAEVLDDEVLGTASIEHVRAVGGRR